MTIKPVTLIVSAIVFGAAIAFVSFYAGGLVGSGTLTDNVSPMGQLAQNTERSMEQFYSDKGHYPKSLAELHIDVIHADGGNQSDVDHGFYIVEGSLAVVIFARHIGPCVVLEFRDGNPKGMRFLGNRSDQ